MLNINSKNTALILIDLQKGLLSRPLAPYSAEQVVTNASRLANHFVNVHATVVLVRISLSNTYVDKLNQPVDVPLPMPPNGLPNDWADLAPELASVPADVRITKRQWGAFYGTELDLQLRRRQITTVVLGGIATNFGVETTAREAWQHNYAVVIAEDASTSMDADLHKFSMQNIMPRIARVRSVNEIVTELKEKT